MIFAERLGARRLSSNQLRRHGDLRFQQFRNRTAGLGFRGKDEGLRLIHARLAAINEAHGTNYRASIATLNADCLT